MKKMAATAAATPPRTESRAKWLAAPVNCEGAALAAVGSAGTVKVAKPPVGAGTVTVLLAEAVATPEAADWALEYKPASTVV